MNKGENKMTKKYNIKDYLDQTKVSLANVAGVGSLFGMAAAYAHSDDNLLMVMTGTLIASNVMKGVDYIKAYCNMQADFYNNEKSE